AAEEICRERPIPIILVPEGPDVGALERALDNPYILACLFQPVKEADLEAAIALAVRRFEWIESSRIEITDLRKALEDRKVIERAKGLVMRYAGQDEQEAFRRLRRVASDRNRKLVEVAQNVVVAAEVFQEIEQLAQARQAAEGHAH